MKLILGKLNNGAIFYWDISHLQLKPIVGDYAIVGNKNDYDLVKIIGIVETSENGEIGIGESNKETNEYRPMPFLHTKRKPMQIA